MTCGISGEHKSQCQLSSLLSSSLVASCVAAHELETTFSWNRLCRRESKVSSGFPLYSNTNAFSSAAATSFCEADCSPNTSACSRNGWLDLNFLNFYRPIPYSRDVVSQPRIAWMKSKFLQIAGPSCSWTARMFHTRGLYCLSWWG